MTLGATMALGAAGWKGNGGRGAAAAVDHAEASRRGPSSDLLVVDVSRVLAGPCATLPLGDLGDLGARVNEVEHPHGDRTRSYPGRPGYDQIRKGRAASWG